MTMDPVTAAIMGGATIATGLLGQRSQKKTNQAQIALSREQMAFQERMSNTAYERAMEDMRRSGINPIMVSKVGGASTPTGAMAQIKDPFQAGVATALQSKQMQQLSSQIRVSDSQVNLNESSTAKNVADANFKDAQTEKLGMDTALTSMDVAALSKLNLSPMQMKHTVFNQAGSEFYKKAKEIAEDAGKQMSDVYDTIYDYVIKEFREQRNYTIPFIANNPHLVMQEMQNYLNKGKGWFNKLISKRGWK